MRLVTAEASLDIPMPMSATATFCEASYYRARYYNLQLQRFVSEDPLRYGGGGPNFYAYVHDNPVNLSDPFGLTDYNEQQTLQLFLQPAYTDATAGFFKGLGNIFDHSRGYQGVPGQGDYDRSEEHTSELQSRRDLVC